KAARSRSNRFPTATFARTATAGRGLTASGPDMGRLRRILIRPTTLLTPILTIIRGRCSSASVLVRGSIVSGAGNLITFQFGAAGRKFGRAFFLPESSRSAENPGRIVVLMRTLEDCVSHSIGCSLWGIWGAKRI